jgi:hypothetical protein
MDSETRGQNQYAQILRLLFKYNLVPRTAEEEMKFIQELIAILKI